MGSGRTTVRFNKIWFPIRHQITRTRTIVRNSWDNRWQNPTIAD